METILDEELPRSRLAVLLKHFSQIEDGRQSWRVAFPLAEMLLLLTCATIADCDDFNEIVAWADRRRDTCTGAAQVRQGAAAVCQADHEAGRRGGRQEGACYANRRPTFVRMTAARCQNGRPVNRSSHNTLKSLEQVKGIEPSSSAWKAPAAVPC